MARYNDKPVNRVAGLRKNAPRLLKLVDGKQHATTDDHEPMQIAVARSTETTVSPLHRSKNDVTDIDAEPLSSSDEEVTPDARDKETSPVPAPKARARNKRKSDMSEQDTKEEEMKAKRQKLEELELFSSQKRIPSNSSNKYKTKGHNKAYNNIHAPPNPQATSIKEAKAPQNDKRSVSKAKKKSSIKFQPTPTANLFEKLSVSKPKAPRSSQTDSLVNGSSQESAITINNDTTSRVEPPPNEYEDHTRCPICQTEVSKEDYDAWVSACPNISLREQRSFCKQHKLRDAQSAWSSKGYPDIDWDTFDARLKQHTHIVRHLVKNPETSVFRAQLEDSVNNGKGRTILKGVQEGGGDIFGVGYYGIRGQQAMTGFITRKFAKKLRKLAVTDRIVAARDVSGYIRMVLVPELAMRLIEDDMKVDSSTAREILDESAEIGVLLNGSDI